MFTQFAHSTSRNMSAHADLVQINAELRASWVAGALKTQAQRVRVLEAVRACVWKHFDGACDALLADLGRNVTEARGELEMVVAEIDAQIAGLKGGWMNPEPRTTHLLLAPAHTEVRREPFGVCLVMSPFNYPINLALTPVVGALAAGNTVLLKPSEQTVRVRIAGRASCLRASADCATQRFCFMCNLCSPPCRATFSTCGVCVCACVLAGPALAIRLRASSGF